MGDFAVIFLLCFFGEVGVEGMVPIWGIGVVLFYGNAVWSCFGVFLLPFSSMVLGDVYEVSED